MLFISRLRMLHFFMVRLFDDLRYLATRLLEELTSDEKLVLAYGGIIVTLVLLCVIALT